MSPNYPHLSASIQLFMYETINHYKLYTLFPLKIFNGVNFPVIAHLLCFVKFEMVWRKNTKSSIACIIYEFQQKQQQQQGYVSQGNQGRIEDKTLFEITGTDRHQKHREKDKNPLESYNEIGTRFKIQINQSSQSPVNSVKIYYKTRSLINTSKIPRGIEFLHALL